jgi:hypothetical protein
MLTISPSTSYTCCIILSASGFLHTTTLYSDRKEFYWLYCFHSELLSPGIVWDFTYTCVAPTPTFAAHSLPIRIFFLRDSPSLGPQGPRQSAWASTHALVSWWPNHVFSWTGYRVNYWNVVNKQQTRSPVQNRKPQEPIMYLHIAKTNMFPLIVNVSGVRVTLRLAVSQFWCRAPSGTHDQIVSPVWLLRSLSSWGALSDERVGLSIVGSLCHIFMSCKNMYISICTIRYVQYVQSRLCEEDYALSYLTYAMTTASHLNGGRPDRSQV